MYCGVVKPDDDLFHEISTLTRVAVDRYTAIATGQTAPVAVEACLAEPAARWVLSAAMAGRSLPINPATVRALQVAVTELEVLA
jgi:hypothetical protein